ncbi:DUF6252 family protein [Bacteroidota bacterium]
MRTIKFNFVFIIVLLLVFSSCDYQDLKQELQYELPAITETGENTFGCVVDSEVLIPRKGVVGNHTFSRTPVEMPLSYTLSSSGILLIEAGNYEAGNNDGISLTIKGLEGLANNHYVLGQIREYKYLEDLGYSYAAISKNNNIYFSTEKSGSIRVTRFDEEVLSGTFQFVAVNKDDETDIIEVYNGRFDINLKTLLLK